MKVRGTVLVRLLGWCGLLAASAWAQNGELLEDLKRPVQELLAGVQSAPDDPHTPRITMPRVVELATQVEVTVEVPLNGDDRHHIRRLALIDENSMVQLKYVATFSRPLKPLKVTAHIKMAKSSRIKAVAECSVHGKWVGISEPIRVGVGGCAAGQEPTRTLTGDVLRVRFRKERAGVQANLLFRHPMISGYTMDAQGRITKSYEPFFLKTAHVRYRGQVVAEFALGPGLSENPRLSLLLPRLGDEPLQTDAINTLEQKFTLRARMPQ